jgi:hypothetical protein
MHVIYMYSCIALERYQSRQAINRLIQTHELGITTRPGSFTGPPSSFSLSLSIVTCVHSDPFHHYLPSSGLCVSICAPQDHNRCSP